MTPDPAVRPPAYEIGCTCGAECNPHTGAHIDARGNLTYNPTWMRKHQRVYRAHRIRIPKQRGASP